MPLRFTPMILSNTSSSQDASGATSGARSSLRESAEGLARDPLAFLNSSRNIILSHACGVGDPLPRPEARAVMRRQHTL